MDGERQRGLRGGGNSHFEDTGKKDGGTKALSEAPWS